MLAIPPQAFLRSCCAFLVFITALAYGTAQAPQEPKAKRPRLHIIVFEGKLKDQADTDSHQGPIQIAPDFPEKLSRLVTSLPDSLSSPELPLVGRVGLLDIHTFEVSGTVIQKKKFLSHSNGIVGLTYRLRVVLGAIPTLRSSNWTDE